MDTAHVQVLHNMPLLSNLNCYHPEVCTWCGFTVNGVALIGHKEKRSLRMLQALISLLLAMMHLIVPADRMTKIVRREDVLKQVMTN
jgi:hypothetical protein